MYFYIYKILEIIQVQIKISPDVIHNTESIKKAVAKELPIALRTNFHFQILKRSIDARSRNPHYVLLVEVADKEIPLSSFPFVYQNVSNCPEVVIIGAGPAGLFAALRLIELNLKPIIIERGKTVRDRRRDLAAINKEGVVNEESNYCFGEGGAGTYSDGKLYTRSTKRGDVNRILQRFIQHGADENIAVDAHPHIGTNKLPHIISSMKEQILACGGEVHFNTKLIDIEIENDAIKNIIISDNKVLPCKALILATGHSARDIYELLHRKGIEIEAKPFALGVRIEHPQTIIDQFQYNCMQRHENFPPASYSIVEQVNNRGMFSFCMCPGGIIAPAATGPNELVVNGWSPSKRNNPFANSGIVVEINAQDMQAFAKESGTDYHALSGMYLQKHIEKLAYEAGGGNLKAPAQRLIDFVEGKHSNDLPDCSYIPGTTSINLHQYVLPVYVRKTLQMAFKNIAKKKKNYYTNDAIILATESRTSSPVRIPRDRETLQHTKLKGLYPCAEGAGYAGGIVSAAIDGENCATAISQWMLG